MEFSEGDAAMAFVLIPLLVILVITGFVGYYHYGYYEGKANAYIECRQPVPAAK